MTKGMKGNRGNNQATLSTERSRATTGAVKLGMAVRQELQGGGRPDDIDASPLPCDPVRDLRPLPGVPLAICVEDGRCVSRSVGLDCVGRFRFAAEIMCGIPDGGDVRRDERE